MRGTAVVFDPHPPAGAALAAETGGRGPVFSDVVDLRDHVGVMSDDDTLVLGPHVSDDEAFDVAQFTRAQRPGVEVILVRREITTGLLQEALRARMSAVVDYRDTVQLRSEVRRSLNRSPETGPGEKPGPRRGRVLTVFSAKGGSGKTMLAVNLAATLADRGHRQVCIVDLDLAFGDVAIAMQLFPAHTIADAVPLGGEIDSSAVAAMLTQHSAGLSAIVAPTEPSTAESIHPKLISHLLDVLRDEFDYVVVDTPPAFDDQVLAALDVSDLITLIVTPDVPALKTLKITVETLIELGYPRDRLRLVLNRSDSRVGISHAEVEKTAVMPLAGQIPSSRDVPSSVNRGVPIVQDDPRHPVSLAIEQFAQDEVIGVGDGTPRRRPRKRRFLR
ncbi:AAA family ATPase [Kineosporia succinea]|uniref:Pilus assembly protein CpaE n=1 Tax=Kineosporia succinea TaxID=84632 RepID=A0ABT9P6C9_9ACTN|nr:AAA family ATPase [Kineosporia succinea]MDP9828250.1 pilus assembly protein CpaE [Kineosporia succinea]